MSGWAAVGIAVVLVGVLAGAPPVVFIGGAILLIRVLAEVWPSRVLGALEYRREIGHTRTVVGDEVEIRSSLWNRTRLPVAWASATDRLPEGISLAPTARTGRFEPGDEDRVALRFSSGLRPYERVTQRFGVIPNHRGVHELGPVRLRVAELFGTHIQRRDPEVPVQTIIARPLMAPIVGPLPADSPLARKKAKRSLFMDPNLFAGVRAFQAGDPVRSVHWRASARAGTLQTKRFEPSLSGQAVLVFDVQTVEGPFWMLVYDEEAFEALAVAALSIARRLISEETATGLAAAGFSGSMQRFIFLPARGDRPQVGRIGDALARLTPESSAPFTELLAWLPRRVAGGTTLLILSARDPLPATAVIRRLRQSGYPVHLFLFGKETDAATARRAGLSAWDASVDMEKGRPRGVAINA